MVYYTLISKNFGRFNFRSNFCPKFKGVRNFRDLIIIQNYFSRPLSSFLDENIPIANLFATTDNYRISIKSDLGKSISKGVIGTPLFYN